ncbi:fibroblast growth factor 23-like [Pantherophis guttatus]|uniref:Fibroblast growth factor 23-like n=1 Tax=Pantherophis guttatus TaxID=94885 RepID=A0ABM3ZJX6_PANGU|nr:fibroblast growth factor 23-like [Pantherophis guttatus]
MSKLSLCMRNNGKLYGSTSLTSDDCVFKHILAETDYDVYESIRYKFLVSLGRVKGVLGPNRNLPRFSQFLTRRNEIPLSQFNTPPPQPQPQPAVPTDNGEDPCGGILDGRIPEEQPLVNGIHPCFLEEDYR